MTLLRGRLLLTLSAALALAGTVAAGEKWGTPRDSPQGGPRQIAWYVTGPSNFESAADLPWPGDNGGYTSSPSIPGSTSRGWWSTIRHYIRPANLSMTIRNNSAGGNSVCNIGHPYCCLEGSLFRVNSCALDDAAGDQVCDLANDAIDDNDATCEQSNIYYLESYAVTPWATPFGGIQTIPTTVVTFAPGPNECPLGNTTAAQIVSETRTLINGFFAAAPALRLVNLHMGISWHKKLSLGTPACANLWETTCAASAGFGGTDCTGTFQDLAAEYGGRVVIEDGPFRQTLGQTSLSGASSLYELYTADQLHENIFGWQLVTLPDALASIGLPVTDRASASPVPVQDSVTASSATFHLAAAVTDPDGDTLTCLLWAVRDADWAGGYFPADRVHNGFGACRTSNGGVPCPACGDTPSDTDCNVFGTITDAQAASWLTPTDAPVVPDGTAEGTSAMPDFFEIACNAAVPRTIHGLAAATTYRLYSIAWPTLVPGSVARGILPSPIYDLVTFTTSP